MQKIKQNPKFRKLNDQINDLSSSLQSRDECRKQLIAYIVEKTDFKSKDFNWKKFLEELFLIWLKEEEIEQIKELAKINWKIFLFRAWIEERMKQGTLPDFIMAIIKISKIKDIYYKLIEFGKWLCKNVAFISVTQHKMFKFWILKIFYTKEESPSCIWNFVHWRIQTQNQT